MRLLRLEEDGEFSLIEHVGKNIPPYAILSHTWGEDHEEVTFKDLKKGIGKSKPGYCKLAFCRKQAAKDNLQYFWVDTCSIDKSSSAELSEAINSMFRWYYESAKCYVYLSDVSTSGFANNDQSFQKSRWFTRGWTLQELLAPTAVEFFSMEGDLLGDKGSLVQEISNTTGISVKALQGSSLSHFSINERMSWTRRRETRREEDMAYSLLGIFNIHMPLIYGEGQEKAMKRLQKEIRESSTNQSLVSSPSPLTNPSNQKPKPSSNVPFNRDRDFMDRPNILTWISEKCTGQSSRAALVGLGGVGKSQIAIQYCYNVQDVSPQTWVFWVHASTQARFEEGYRRIAEAAKIDGWDNPKADVLRLVRSWLCDKSNGRWMMVVDSADDLSVFFPPAHGTLVTGATNLSQSAEPLSDFLPQSANGSILVTSRSRDVAFRLTGSQNSIIEIKPLEKDDALALLRKKLGFDTDDRDVTELLQTLDYMPLAITQAAAYIVQRAPRMTVSRYLDEVRRSDHDRARLLKKDVGDSRRDGRASNSIIATWQISFEYIRKESPTAARLLSLMSLLDCQGIPELLLRGRYQPAADLEADFDDDIHTLTSYSLVGMSANGSEFEMHRLVQFSTKKWLELYNELEDWKRTYVMLMNDNYPVGRHENWTVCQALFPHALAAVEYEPKGAKAQEAWASVLFKAAWYAGEMGQYDIAQRMGSAAFRARESLLGAEHPDTLSSLNNLGLVLDWQGRYGEACAIHQRGLEAKGRVLGAEHPDTLTSMGNLASTYRNQGRWKEAEGLEVQVLDTSQRVLGEEHPDTLTSMANLASTYRNQGRWREAEELEVQVMDTRKRVLGEEHPDTLTSMANLASTYRNQGWWKEAEELQEDELEICSRVLGEEHPDTLTSMANLASTYQDQGRWKEAEELGKQAVDTRKRVLGEEHPDTLTSIGNLASTYQNQGRWKEAEELEVQVIDRRKKVLGEEHPYTLVSIANLASTYRNQGRWKGAEELEVQVMDTRRRVLGKEHPDTLASMGNLAFTYWNQGRWKEAEELEVQVVDTSLRVLGEEHPDTLTSMANLASTYQNQGRWNEAEELEVRVMDTRKRVLGEEHPDNLTSMANLASTYHKQGRWKEAEELEVQVMNRKKRVLGEEHPDTLTSMANLASTYRNQGRWKEAEELEVQAMDRRKKVLGEEHPDTLASMNNLAFTLKSQGRNDEAILLMERFLPLGKQIFGSQHPYILSSLEALTKWQMENLEIKL
ncbi:TPR-like protein [Lindgomyces ingoldianus]|uniref:TPR-like protein n=1 Tax=Lindgomyces ingoldianus TaxID=673940 RepID=A0ACB6QWD4_9PLEO|nr:TPR-like protein [Lindgomyces ingoldianus]KAF2470888.1 TPR-like protein [Lindgomyces ingoldianus]